MTTLMQLNLNDWANIATIAGVVLALLTLFYTAYQIRLSRKVNQATFWLELRKMFAEHNEVHLLLRGGDWSSPNSGPRSRDEWAKVEAYMGLFEHCKLMLDDGLIDWKTFRDIYGYRVKNLVTNSVIVREKLILRNSGWEDFIQLVRKLRLQAVMLEVGQGWLSSPEGQAWLMTEAGKNWPSTPEGHSWKSMK